MFPIKVPESRVRITAGLVFLTSLMALIFGSPWLFLVLAADFALRAFIRPQWSPFSMLSRRAILPLLAISEKAQISFAPKRFAAAIGFFLSGGAFILGILGLYPGLILCGGVLALFSLLESALGFCAGCKIYTVLIRLGLIPQENCPECKF